MHLGEEKYKVVYARGDEAVAVIKRPQWNEEGQKTSQMVEQESGPHMLSLGYFRQGTERVTSINLT